jgi:predicted RNA-binding protein with PUA-like domain
MMKKAGYKENHERQYWLWVTKPEYYLDDDGNERSELDPSSREDLWGSWTCHKDTKKGDLALLWRSRKYLGNFLASKGIKTTIGPKSDIAYLFQVSDDAYLATEKNTTKGWSYGCECVPVYKFKIPLTISEIKTNPYLKEWNALKGKFQHSAFRISIEDWKRLNKLLSTGNDGYKKVLDRFQKGISPRIITEEKIEKRLVNNLGHLRPFGYNFELYQDPQGEKGQQYYCKGGAGIIDLLCYDKKTKKYVVIEIKNVKANQNTFGQISSYIGWVKKNISHKVKGLVISRGMDMRFELAMEASPNVSQLNVRDLGFK